MTPPSSFLGRFGLSRKILHPKDIVLGCAWLGPGSGQRISARHPDMYQKDANALVRAAVAAGIKEFDVAPLYGSASAEALLGTALGETGVTNDVSVGTKAGRLFWEPDGQPALTVGRPSLTDRICQNDYSAQGTRTSLSHSLKRLRLKSVDTLRIHDPNDNSNNNRHSSPNFVDEVAKALAPGGMIEELRAMIDRGEIRRIGLGMNTNLDALVGSPQDVLCLLQEAPPGTFDSALLAGGWNLLCQTGWDCLLQCQLLNVDVYVAGIFGSGFLADDSKSYAYQDTVPPQLLQKKQQWSDLAFHHNYSLPAVALAFAALPMAMSRLVIGPSTEAEFRQIMEWVEESNTIHESFWEEAAHLGLWHVRSDLLKTWLEGDARGWMVGKPNQRNIMLHGQHESN